MESENEELTGRARSVSTDYIKRVRRAAEIYEDSRRKSDGTGSVGEGHAFLNAGDMDILEAVATVIETYLSENFFRRYTETVKKIKAQVTDPLPVMAMAADWIDIQATLRNEGDAKMYRKLIDTIAAIKRERGQTEAAKHVDKLKEASDEHEPTP